MPNPTALSAEEAEATAQGCGGERREMPPGKLCVSDSHQQSGDWFPKPAWAIGWFGAHQSWEGSGMEIRGSQSGRDLVYG